MPTRFRTIKLISYAVRKQGGTIRLQDSDYIVELPGRQPTGPFNRSQLISWANQHLP